MGAGHRRADRPAVQSGRAALPRRPRSRDNGRHAKAPDAQHLRDEEPDAHGDPTPAPSVSYRRRGGGRACLSAYAPPRGPRRVAATLGPSHHGRRQRARREHVRRPGDSRRPPAGDRRPALGLVHGHARRPGLQRLRGCDGPGERPGDDGRPPRDRPQRPSLWVLEGRQRQDLRRGPRTGSVTGHGARPPVERLPRRDHRDREGAAGGDERRRGHPGRWRDPGRHHHACGRPVRWFYRRFVGRHPHHGGDRRGARRRRRLVVPLCPSARTCRRVGARRGCRRRPGRPQRRPRRDAAQPARRTRQSHPRRDGRRDP